MKKFLLSLLVLSFCATHSFAAVDMFLHIEGVDGETTDKVHSRTKDIDILAWSWGMSNSGSAQVGGGAGAGKASFQDLSLTKYVDLSSVKLMEGVATGKHFTSATLFVRKAGVTPVEYIKITMTEVLVTSLSTGGSGGEDRLTENISLNFAKFKFEYVQVDDTGRPKPAVEFNFDIAGNVAQ